MDEDSLLKNVPEPVLIESDDEIEGDEEFATSDSEESEKRLATTNASKLSAHVRGLMGEANLRFARGDIDLAKKMCFEVIRQAPEAFEPYLTLAQMYENNNIKKYKGFLILAAHLYPANYEVWCRLADVHIQENQMIDAVRCYNRAIKARPRNVELHMKRLNFIQDKVPSRAKNIPTLKLNMAKILPKNKHPQILEICSEVAKQYYKDKNYIRAIDALKICMKRIPDNTNQDVLNMMLELLLLSGRYSECLDIFTQFCGFQFDLTVGEEMSIILNSYAIPENLHIDLKTKFIVCLIGLESYVLVEGLIKEMLEEEDIEENGTLYFDIAEALMTSHYYNEALQLLILLVKSKNFSFAAIWLKHAECLTHLHLYEQAIDAYKTVIQLAPNHVDVLYPLAMLLLKLDRKREALEVLSQDLSSGKLHVAVLIEQMKLLKQIGDFDNYWKCCELLLSRHCIVLKNYSELRVALLLKTSVKEKQNKISKIRIVKPEDDSELDLEYIFEPSVEEEYKLYQDILQLAYERREFSQLQKFAFMGLSSKKFSKYFSEIFVIACYASIFNKDYYHGYLITRDFLIRQPNNNNAWNLYALLAHKLEEGVKMNRFFEASTLRSKLPSENTDLIKANHFCTVAHYHECLSYFLRNFRETKNSYSAFMIGMTMLQQFCQRRKFTNETKSIIEMVTYLFFNYAKIRSKYAQQEVYYNLGRMYQQIGLFHLAEHYYKMVFNVKNEYLEKYPDQLDLKMEAAYNLHLIYKSSGNLEAARSILWKYVVI